MLRRQFFNINKFSTLKLYLRCPDPDMQFALRDSELMKAAKSNYNFLAVLIAIYTLNVSQGYSQVSLPDRNPLKLTVRAGAMSNNGDLAAQLNMKSDGELGHTVDMYYAAIGDVELSIDLLHFRGAGLGIQFSGMVARPELKSTDTYGNSQRVAMTEIQIIRSTLSFSFNGSDPYTMFELPYHSNKEAVLGISAMVQRTNNTKLTSYATDTLGIESINGDWCSSLGINFGWNWRLGQSGWVIGISGDVMFVINKSHLVDVKTKESSLYTSDRLDFAPRIITAGFGYHF
ncbi:MAG TPA: hypothetical protein PLI47_02230 [Bacteroidia bacterium]|nr:hypothetical protein [Bacteroidia bacterium]